MWLIDNFAPVKQLALWVVRRLPRSSGLRGQLQWWLNAKFTIGTSCVLFDDERRVLLVRHTYKRYPWGLPGGTVGRRESVAQATLRELYEEAGVEGKIVRLLGVRTEQEWRLVDVFYLCRGQAREFVPSAEISARGWFAIDALPEGISPRLRGLIDIVYKREFGGPDNNSAALAAPDAAG